MKKLLGPLPRPFQPPRAPHGSGGTPTPWMPTAHTSGTVLLVVGIVFALVFYSIASSKRRDENTECNDRCAPHHGLVIKTNAGEDALTCMCKWEDGALHAPGPRPTEMIGPRPPEGRYGMNLDDDAFWDSTAPVDTGMVLADVPDTLVEYGQVLRACFPFVTPFVGLALGSKPRACTILGSHLIEVSDTGDAKWWQTVGSRPIPPNYNFASPPLGQKIPASTCFLHRRCKSPKDFRLWLQAVVADMRKTAIDMFLEALCTDNFMATPAITLQQAHNLYLTGMTEIVQAPPLNAWVEAKDRSNTYSIPLLRKGQVMGQIVLGWKDDAWRYGVVVHATVFGGELKIKHQAPATVQLRHLDVAKAAAVKLYYRTMFDFLVQTAINNPTLRGA